MLQQFLSSLRRIAQVTLDPAKTLWIGVDVGSRRHTACFGTLERPLQRRFVFTNTRDGLQRLVEAICKHQRRNGHESVVVGMEPTGMYWKPLQVELGRRGIVVVLVGSQAVKHNRKTLREPSKTDEKDAYAVWDLLRQGKAFLHVERDAECEAAYRLMQHYDDTRRRVAQIRNQLRSALALVFPELNGKFPSLERLGALRFLQKNPTPQSIRKLGRKRFLQRWRGRRGRWGREFFEELYELSKTSLGVPDPTGSSDMMVRSLAEELEYCLERKQRWFEQAKALLQGRRDYQILLSVRGIGEKIAVGLLSSLGSVHRFCSGKQWVKLAGLHVVWVESGESVRRTPRISRQGKALLRTWLYQAALSLIRYPGRFRDLNQRRRKSSPGKGSHARALMAVADKLVRMLFAMLRDETLYDPSRDEYWEAHYTSVRKAA